MRPIPPRSTEFNRVLVANRGEIACRVIRGAQALGYATVAVYSDADRDARHVQLADNAVRIGPPAAEDSYLHIDRILAAARESGAQAIHPGYGFLSENAKFARAVEQAGLIFIGPAAASIDLMGNKRAAKERMNEAGVPCIPGFGNASASNEELARKARDMGLPVMVKAAAGGGGRGMRLVEDDARLESALRSARSEALGAFGNGEIILEKAVVDGRHVEIQIFADHQGNAVHLGERDCSIQRRHQKLVEESPSPAVNEPLRRRMGEAAVTAARAIGYVGAGTVEFLLAPDGTFYFLEMNTRLQVEHPVTEMRTGQDLVTWQLQVAAGKPLPLTQEEIPFRGHAMEVRLCTEDTNRDFLPVAGRLLAWQPPAGEGIRVDHGLWPDQTITSHYDSMQAKIIAWGDDREQARRRLLKALRECLFLGLPCNRDFLIRVLRHEAFINGVFDTGFIGTHFPPDKRHNTPHETHHALACSLFFHTDTRRLQTADGLDPELACWRNSHPAAIPFRLRVGDTDSVATLLPLGSNAFRITAGDQSVELKLRASRDQAEIAYTVDGTDGRARYARNGNQLFLATEDTTLLFRDVLLDPPRREPEGNGEVLAPMDGRILAVHCKPGDQVQRGATLVVLEAMKMETELTAAIDGEVQRVEVSESDQAARGQLLVTLAEHPDTTDPRKPSPSQSIRDS